MEDILKELNRFLGKASLATYSGSGPETDTQTSEFTELEFKEGTWSYRDSYTGFFQSWGRETVWYNEKPFWTQLYGGGMVKKFQNNSEFALKTFQFLKKAMSEREKIKDFQPRGPKHFAEDDWKYQCEWKGDITKFEGNEKILFKGKVVFTHDFLGGLVKSD